MHVQYHAINKKLKFSCRAVSPACAGRFDLVPFRFVRAFPFSCVRAH